MINEVEKILSTSLSLDQLLEKVQSGEPGEKEKALQGLAGWLSHIPGYSDKRGNLLLPENANIPELVKKNMGIYHGKNLYRKLPEFTSGTIDELMKVDPTLAYMLSVPLLEKLGEYAGVGGIGSNDFSGMIEKIDKGKISKDEAKQISKEYAEKYLRPAFENDPRIEGEDIEELMDIYTEVWSEGASTKMGKALLKREYGELYIAPWMNENKEKITGYAESIKNTALANKKASSYEGYSKIKEYMMSVISVMEGIKKQYQKQEGYNTEMENNREMALA